MICKYCKLTLILNTWINTNFILNGANGIDDDDDADDAVVLVPALTVEDVRALRSGLGSGPRIAPLVMEAVANLKVSAA